jgi:hypothetical protein
MSKNEVTLAEVFENSLMKQGMTRQQAQDYLEGIEETSQKFFNPSNPEIARRFANLDGISEQDIMQEIADFTHMISSGNYSEEQQIEMSNIFLSSIGIAIEKDQNGEIQVKLVEPVAL